MSIYPCDIHGSRIRGPLDAFYLSVMLDDGWMNRRLRSCRLDLDSFVEEHDKSIPLIDFNSVPTHIEACENCHSDFVSIQDAVPVLLYVYRKGEEPEERYGSWCKRCARNLAVSMHLQPRQDLEPRAS